MVNQCCAFNCTSKSNGRRDLKFHRFPLKDKKRLEKWKHAVGRENFEPKSSSFLCSLHFPETEYTPAVVSGEPMLKRDAIPTMFDSPYMEKDDKRNILPGTAENQDLSAITCSTNEFIHSKIKTEIASVGCMTTLTGEALEKTLCDLRQEKKILQQKLKRRNERISTMQEMLTSLQKKRTSESILEDFFGKESATLPFMLCKNEIENAEKVPTHRSYSNEIKQFCLILYSYSPRAYNFVRHRSALPDPSSVRRWLATKNCNPRSSVKQREEASAKANQEDTGGNDSENSITYEEWEDQDIENDDDFHSEIPGSSFKTREDDTAEPNKDEVNDNDSDNGSINEKWGNQGVENANHPYSEIFIKSEGFS